MYSLDARDVLKRLLMTQISLIFVIRNYLSGLISKCIISEINLHHNFLTNATFTSVAGRHVCLVPAVRFSRARVLRIACEEPKSCTQCTEAKMHILIKVWQGYLKDLCGRPCCFLFGGPKLDMTLLLLCTCDKLLKSRRTYFKSNFLLLKIIF